MVPALHCHCRGGRYQGHKKTEKFLPVGAIITVVGELARNSISSGSLQRFMLRPPAPHGSPFYISNKGITELHMALARRAGVYTVSGKRLEPLPSRQKHSICCVTLNVYSVESHRQNAFFFVQHACCAVSMPRFLHQHQGHH